MTSCTVLPSSESPFDAAPRRRRVMTAHRFIPLLLMTAALLSACGGSSPEKSLASAQAYLREQNVKAAVIELKNALQKAPDLAPARFLLGQALLESGDPVSAVVEFRKAAELRHPANIVVPPLARALNAAGNSRKLIEEYGQTVLTDPAAQADLKVSLANAQAAEGNPELAARELAAALAASPDNPDARLFEARLKASQGNVKSALAITDAVLRAAPAHEAAWLLKGFLQWRGQHDEAGASEAYRRALALRKASLEGHAGVITIALETQHLDAAVAQQAELKKFWPSHPQTRLFDARIALQRGDYKEARRLTQQLLALAPAHQPLLYVAGVADYLSGATVQAENTFNKALQAAPDNLSVRQMLARSELRLGQAAKAMAVIQPALDNASPNAQTLSIAAQAQQLLGNHSQAQQLYTRAAQADPTDTQSRTALALAKLSQGDSGAALTELQAIAQADKGTATDLELINALLSRKAFTESLAAVDRLDKKQPKAALVPYLRGNILLAKGDVAAARAAYEQALGVDAQYFLAAARLAGLDSIDKKPDQARKRFERILAADPKNEQALMAMVELAVAANASADEIASLLRNAIKANPQEATPRLRLVDLYLRNGNATSALAAAQEAAAALPDDVQILEALGAAQFASGDLNQAGASFGKLASLQPEAPNAFVRLADVQSAAKNTDGALQNLRRALALAPTSLVVQRKLVLQLLSAGRTLEALEVARAVQKQPAPNDAVGHVFEGDIEAGRKNWPAAAAAFQAALARGKSTDAAVKLHAVLIDGRRPAEADKMAAAWLAQSPRDVVFIAHLGDTALLANDFASAQTRFLEVLRIDPANAVASNNVAALRSQLKMPGALAYAEKANALRPDHPPFMDTLATALADDKQLKRALEVQKKAADLQPDNPLYRFHLAKLQLQQGDKTAARAELERLAALGDKFAGQAEVARLLKAL